MAGERPKDQPTRGPARLPQHPLIEALQYRLPLAGMVSILHRISGMLMFLLLPFIIWMFDASVSPRCRTTRFTSAFTAGIGVVPGWLIKLVALALIWAYLHHFIAGVRHLWMDDPQRHQASRAIRRPWPPGRQLLLTVLLGAKLFGLY
jgi:succinate dehydrogenase / fumarate reductase cytochrome b subunit